MPGGLVSHQGYARLDGEASVAWFAGFHGAGVGEDDIVGVDLGHGGLIPCVG
jgi:hypothetical protein